MKNSNYTQKVKNRNMLLSFGSFLLCSVVSLLSAPWFIAIIGFVSLGLGIASYRKKSVEERQVIELLEKQKELNEQNEEKDEI